MLAVHFFRHIVCKALKSLEMHVKQGIRVLPLIRIPLRPQLLIQAPCKTKTPTTKKLPPMAFSDPISPNDAPQATNAVHEPLTPMARNDIRRLLRSTFPKFDFRYISVYSLSDFQKNDEDGSKKVDHIIQIFATAGNEDKATIAKCVMSNLIRETPKFERPNLFAESSPIYTVSNSEQLEKLHFLFQKIIESNPSIMSRRFINQLIRQLDSNVDFERNEIEKEIIIYLKNNHAARPFIIHGLMSRLIVFLENAVQNSPYSISSILRIFVFYFNNVLTGKLSNRAFLMFQTVFFPLLANENYLLYEKPLKDISSFFLKKKPEMALWAINYLCQHWPISSPRKELAFLQQLGFLLNFTDPDQVDSVAQSVSRAMAKCISSQTMNVSVSAMLDLQSNSILSYFDESRKGMFLNDLIPALEIASKNWKEQLREMSSKLLSHLSEIQTDLTVKKINQRNLKKEKQREEVWTTIRTIARAQRKVNSQKTRFHSKSV